MSIGHPDFQRIEQWLGGALAEETLFPVSAGLDSWGPFNVASWRTVALSVLPVGSDITVQLTWSHSSVPFAPVRQDVWYVGNGLQLFTLCPIYADTVELTIARGGGATTVDLGLWPTNLEHDNGINGFTGNLVTEWPNFVLAGATEVVRIRPYSGRARIVTLASGVNCQIEVRSHDHGGALLSQPFFYNVPVANQVVREEIVLTQGINSIWLINPTATNHNFYYSIQAARD